MKKNRLKQALPIIVFAIIAISAYFINVEVQSYYGRQALENAGLVSLPFETALEKAGKEKKLVLVDVSAIWCPTCRKLDNEIFANETVRREIGQRFVFSRLEYESEEGQKFLEKHRASGFPSLFLIDADGKVVKKLKVTFDSGEFLRQLER